MEAETSTMVGGCCVCSDEVGYTENPLVYCDGTQCNVAVHQGRTQQYKLISRAYYYPIRIRRYPSLLRFRICQTPSSIKHPSLVALFKSEP